MFGFFTHFKSNNFRRLFFAQMISQFGDRIHQMALIGLVAERTVHLADPSTTAINLAKLISFTIIPVFVVGPVAGVYVDRWDRRTTLFVCDFLRALLVAMIPLYFIYWESLIPTYIIVFLIFCFSRFYVPAKMSIIPDIVESEYLLIANSLLTTTGMIAFVLGAALGGFLIDNLGARVGFLWDSITYLVSGILILSMTKLQFSKINREKIKEAAQVIHQSVWVDMKEGLHYLIHHKEIRFIIKILFVLLGAAGTVYIVLIVFIQQAFQSITKDLGILAVALGLGLSFGAILYGRAGKKFSCYKTIFSCLLISGIMINGFAWMVGYSSNLMVACLLSVGIGLSIGPIFIAANTLAHQVSDENMRGKVFTALEMVIHFAFLVTMLISSFLTRIIQPMHILVWVGVFVAIVGIIGLASKEPNVA
jgi:MFS family permease